MCSHGELFPYTSEVSFTVHIGSICYTGFCYYISIQRTSSTLRIKLYQCKITLLCTHFFFNSHIYIYPFSTCRNVLYFISYFHKQARCIAHHIVPIYYILDLNNIRCIISEYDIIPTT